MDDNKHGYQCLTCLEKDVQISKLEELVSQLENRIKELEETQETWTDMGLETYYD